MPRSVIILLKNGQQTRKPVECSIKTCQAITMTLIRLKVEIGLLFQSGA